MNNVLESEKTFTAVVKVFKNKKTFTNYTGKGLANNGHC